MSQTQSTRSICELCHCTQRGSHQCVICLRTFDTVERVVRHIFKYSHFGGHEDYQLDKVRNNRHTLPLRLRDESNEGANQDEDCDSDMTETIALATNSETTLPLFRDIAWRTPPNGEDTSYAILSQVPDLPESENSETGDRRKRARAYISPVWHFYRPLDRNRVNVDAGDPVVCVLCGKLPKPHRDQDGKVKFSTSNLRSHLKSREHGMTDEDIESYSKKKKTMYSYMITARPPLESKLEASRIRRLIAEHIVAQNLSFTTVESRSFAKLMEYLVLGYSTPSPYNQYGMPSRRAIVNEISERIYPDCKRLLKKAVSEKLSGRFWLCYDNWTDGVMRGYLGATIHGLTTQFEPICLTLGVVPMWVVAANSTED